MSTMRGVAPAKANLALAITGRRDDGYHALESVFVRLGLHDDLAVDIDRSAGRDQLLVDGEPSAAGAADLVLLAVAQLRNTLVEPLPPLRFELTKRIPMAAGLGGGSSDAATAIDLALGAWGARLDPAQRLDVALRLGADVPFFSAGHPAAVVTGIGEGLQPLPAPRPPAGVLLITPPGRLSTASVFAEFDRHPGPVSVATERVHQLAGILREGVDGPTLAATTPMLRDANDLWAPAARCSPSLSAARDAAAAALDRAVLLTGSGPTLLAVYPSVAAAEHAAEQLRSERPTELEGALIQATSTAITGDRP